MTNEDIFKELGLNGASDEDRQKILNNIVIVTEARCSSLIDEMLTDEQAARLNEEVDKNDPEAVAEWFKDNMPEVGQLYEAIMQEHIEELKKALDRPPVS